MNPPDTYNIVEIQCMHSSDSARLFVDRMDYDQLREQVEKLQADTDRLDFLDRNLTFNTGWSVGIAPVGLISVTAVGLKKTTIREAIDNARNEK